MTATLTPTTPSTTTAARPASLWRTGMRAGAATTLTLMLAHLVAAAIVIPVLCSVTPKGATMSR